MGKKTSQNKTLLKTPTATARRTATSHTGGRRSANTEHPFSPTFPLHIQQEQQNTTTHHILKPPKNQKQKSRPGTASNKITGGGAWTSLRPTNPRPWFRSGPPEKQLRTKHKQKCRFASFSIDRFVLMICWLTSESFFDRSTMSWQFWRQKSSLRCPSKYVMCRRALNLARNMIYRSSCTILSKLF